MFQRHDETQPRPGAVIRFRYHVRTAEEETEDGVEGAKVTVARWDRIQNDFIDTGIPFTYSDPFDLFNVPTTEGETVYGVAMYWPDSGEWEVMPRCP